MKTITDENQIKTQKSENSPKSKSKTQPLIQTHKSHLPTQQKVWEISTENQNSLNANARLRWIAPSINVFQFQKKKKKNPNSNSGDSLN